MQDLISQCSHKGFFCSPINRLLSLMVLWLSEDYSFTKFYTDFYFQLQRPITALHSSPQCLFLCLFLFIDHSFYGWLQFDHLPSRPIACLWWDRNKISKQLWCCDKKGPLKSWFPSSSIVPSLHQSYCIVKKEDKCGPLKNTRKYVLVTTWSKVKLCFFYKWKEGNYILYLSTEFFFKVYILYC